VTPPELSLAQLSRHVLSLLLQFTRQLLYAAQAAFALQARTAWQQVSASHSWHAPPLFTEHPPPLLEPPLELLPLVVLHSLAQLLSRHESNAGPALLQLAESVQFSTLAPLGHTHDRSLLEQPLVASDSSLAQLLWRQLTHSELMMP
jgi:hypothetical protein